MKFKIFNENIFKDHKDILWFDRTGIVKIDEKRRAEITLTEGNTKDHYTNYLVKIINKETGEIARHGFKFEDYLSPNDRIDQRKDYKSGYHVWDSDNLDWYIARPSEKNLQNLTTAVMNYIDLYR